MRRGENPHRRYSPQAACESGMIRCDSGADSEEGRCLRSLDEKRRVYDRNTDRYVSVISWDDLCAAGGVSSGGFFSVMINSSRRQRTEWDYYERNGRILYARGSASGGVCARAHVAESARGGTHRARWDGRCEWLAPCGGRATRGGSCAPHGGGAGTRGDALRDARAVCASGADGTLCQGGDRRRDHARRGGTP